MSKLFFLVSFTASIFLSGCAIKNPDIEYVTQNLLINNSFEDIVNGKFTSWSGDFLAIRSDDPKPKSGKYYLMGSKSNKSQTIAYQRVFIRQRGVNDELINTGALSILFGGFQSGWHKQRDNGQIIVEFHSRSGSLLNTSKLRPFYSNNKWVQISGMAHIPHDTYSITFNFVAQRMDGENNDGYLDDAFIYIVRY